MFVSLKEIFPHLLHQSKAEIKYFPKALLNSQESLGDKLATTYEQSLKNRRPLQMQREIQRPKPIQSYRPMFDEEFNNSVWEGAQSPIFNEEFYTWALQVAVSTAPHV